MTKQEQRNQEKLERALRRSRRNLNIATKLHTKLFRAVERGKSTGYEVTNLALKECAESVNWPDYLRSQIHSTAAELLEPDLDPDDVLEISEILNYKWVEPVSVKQIGWPGDDSWALKKIPFSPQDGPTPALDEFLQRTSDPKAVLAFIWSIFEPLHQGRQCLWLVGEGLDGKSKLMSVLAELLGNAAAVVDDTALKGAFMAFDVYDKRLVIYPECRVPTFAGTPLFRSMTGGETMNINGKYLRPFSAYVYNRVMVGSNDYPTIDSTVADRSRLLIVTVTKGRRTADWPEKLKAELPFILGAARKAYGESCKNHLVISANKAVEDAADTATAAITDNYLHVFSELFRVDMTTRIERHVFQAACMRYFQGSRHQYMQFKKFVMKIRGVREKKDCGKWWLIGVDLKGQGVL
jgi:hypothetical protein